MCKVSLKIMALSSFQPLNPDSAKALPTAAAKAASKVPILL